MMRRRAAYTFLALALMTLYWGCPGPVKTVDRGGSEVVGKTVTKAGTAVADAKVIALQRIDSSYSKVDSTTSNANGQFTFTDLDTGTYKLFGMAVNGDTLVGLKSNIINNRIAPKGEPPVRVDAGDLVLLPKGWISGTVIIDKADRSGVLCYTRDSAFMAVSREDGSYTIPRVAEGTYTVCFFYPGYLPAKVDGISVVSGSGTTVPPVYMQLDTIGEPNAPRGLFASYDTVHGVVGLRWNKVPVADLRDYIVYRKNATTVGEPPPFDTVIASDTVFLDTVFRSFTDTVEKSLVYQVKAVDNTNNQSPFSDAVQILAVPPSRVRPVVRSISADTAVEFGGTVMCRITFINAFNNYQIYLMQGKGSSWVPISHSAEGVADTSFSTGTSSTWGKVSFRIKFSTDSLDTSFTVHVKPRPVAIVSADSTDSTIILKWNRSSDADFKEYAVHRTAGTDTVIFHSTGIADTAFTYKTLGTTPAGYWVAVADTEGAQSTFDSAMVKRLCIVNTPPIFTTDPATLPGSALAGEEYNVTFSADDRNGDTLSFALLFPDSALMNGNALFWTPTIKEQGMQRCTVTVHDNHGGIDTLTWTVSVAAHGMWVGGDSLLGARMQCGIGEINGKIYVVGGSTYTTKGSTIYKFKALQTVEAYDTATKKWSAKNSLAKARNAPFVGVWNGLLYAMGGYDDYQRTISSIEEYNPQSNTWTTIGQQMQSPRGYGASCVVGNKFYCFGGRVFDSTKRDELIVKTIDVFDMVSKTWSTIPGSGMLYARTEHQAQFCNGKIYIVGGWGGIGDSIAKTNDNYEILTSVEVFDPLSNSCDPFTPLQTPRSTFAMAVSGSTLYAIGGRKEFEKNDNSILGDMESINTESGLIETTPLPLFIHPRHSAAAIGINNRIYYISGGISPDLTTTDRSVVIYYP